MDSRIMEALEARNSYISLLIDELNDVVGIASVHGWSSNRAELGEQARNRIAKADAILTAEPEPCEDARWVDPSDGKVYYSLTAKEYASVYKELTQRISEAQSSTQVADKRTEGLRSENDRLMKRVADLEKELATQILVNTARLADQLATEREKTETLREFVSDAVQWSEAYPENIFTAPTPEQVDAVCKTLGFRIDRIAAMVLREFIGRLSDKARALLAATEPKLSAKVAHVDTRVVAPDEFPEPGMS